MPLSHSSHYEDMYLDNCIAVTETDMLLSTKQETSRLLGEDTEERQARQLIAHKRQDQHRNSISKRKRSDPER